MLCISTYSLLLVTRSSQHVPSEANLLQHFYRTMHFSAKRGLAIACCLSVRLCPSVMLVDCDHVRGWNSSKIISRLASVRRSLSACPNIMDLLQGEYPEIWAKSDPPSVDLNVGYIRSQIAAEWLQIAQRSQWRAYWKPPLLFRMVPSLTTTRLRPTLPSKMGFHMPQDTRMAISPQKVSYTLYVWF